MDFKIHGALVGLLAASRAKETFIAPGLCADIYNPR